MRRTVAVILAGLFAASLAACGSPGTTTSLTYAIDVFGPYRGSEADRFAASLRGFERATGIEVNYTGSADFVSDLRQRATDWLEDVVLRVGGPAVYDQWTTGEMQWDDPVIRESLATVDELVVATGRSAGGLRSILQVDVADASEPMFDDPLGCAMYKQAAFAESWFPDGVEIGVDVDFFVLPGQGSATLAPMLVGADSLVQFSSDDRVDQLTAYLVSPDGGREWAKRGGYLSARTSVDLDSFHTDTDRRFAELLLDGRELRFDASDLMAPDIGAGLLWTQITAWVAGTSSLDEFVTTIDEAIAISDEP